MSPRTLRSAFAACLVWAVAGCEAPTLYEVGAGPEIPSDAEASRPTFSVGDEFWFDTGELSILVEVFAGEEDGLLVFRRELKNESLYYSRDLALVKILRRFGADQWFDPDDGMLDFPLKVGKTWRKSYQVMSSDSLETVHRTRDCRVVDVGQISVPAGRFAAYRVECTARALGDARVAHEEIFYAPSVGRVILHRTRDGAVDIRLTEFSRAR